MFGGMQEVCRVTGRVPAGEGRMFGHLGGKGHMFRVIMGWVREVFGGRWEVCCLFGEVTASVGEMPG